jgi:hypothetical protein
MGLELTTFLLFMSEQEGCRYDALGHFTKDDDGVLVLVSNLFYIMGDKNQNYLIP